MKKISKLKKDLSVTFLGSIINAACNIIWLSLISRNYGLEQYGIYVICQNIGIFIATFANIRTADLIYKFHKNKKETYEFIKLISLLITFLISTLIFILCLLLISTISDKIYPEIPPEMIFFSFLYMLFFSYNNYSLAILRCAGKFDLLIKIEVAFKIAQIIIGSVFIFLSKMNVSILEIFIFWVAINSLLQIFLIKKSTQGIFKTLNRKILVKEYNDHKDSLKKILFHSNLLGYFKIATSPGDTFLLGIFASTTQVAMYNIALQVINVGILVKNNLSNVLTAKIIQLYTNNTAELKRFVLKYNKYSTILSIFFLAFIYLLGKPILDIFFGYQPNEIKTLLLLMSLNYVITLTSLCYYPIALCESNLKNRTIVLALKISFLFLYILIFGLTPISFVVIELFFSILIRLVNDFPLHRKVFHD